MKKRIFRYLMHVVITFVILAIALIAFGLYHGASFRYSENPAMMDWDKDGPYIFLKNDSTITVNYIRGNQENGFYLDEKDYAVGSKIPVSCYSPIDSTYFEFITSNEIKSPKCIYNDSNRILATSDIESSFKAFREFLINNGVIDKHLNWTFGNGHLVLLGDFVDRDFSTTQVLWFIYQLEQKASKKGGNVHYILGNHELKNMQGNFESTAPKYYHIASILKKHQIELYDTNSILGQWISSKNTIEKINDILFTHGGIHPELNNYKITLDEINQIVHNNYYKPYYPNPTKNSEQLLISSHKGIAWYRGYFKDNLTQKVVENGLKQFDAKAIVVGHTLQSKVNKKFNGKVIGIDVKHPKDYSKSIPNPESEGLLINRGKFYRLLNNGEKEEL